MEKSSIRGEEVAKKAGLNPVTCPHCGKSFSVLQNLKSFFATMLDEAKAGKRVMIRDFGVFVVKLIKGHSIETPLVPGMTGYGDTHALRFRQSKAVRLTLNKKKPAAPAKKGAKK